MTTLTENELIALIRSSRPEDKVALEMLLDTTPPQVVNDLLHGIASNIPVKDTSRTVRWVVVLIGGGIGGCFYSSIFWIIQDLRLGKPFWPTLGRSPIMNALTFLSLFLVAREKHKRYRGTDESLFLLSARNDVRVLPLLLRHWRREPTANTKAWNDRVETEATRLLDENRIGTSSAEWKTIRSVVMLITQANWKPVKRAAQDITAGQAYLAAAILRVLAHAGGAKNGQPLKAISELPADAGQFPNRALVVEAAHIYYGVPDADPLTVARHSLHSNPVSATCSNTQTESIDRELLTASAQKGKR